MSGVIADGFRLVESENEFVLLDIKHDRILKLNRVGAQIWSLARAGHTEPQIVHAISKQYKVDEPRVTADVRGLLQRIAELDLSPADIAVQVKAQAGGTINKPSFPWYGQTALCDTATEARFALVLSALLGLVAFDLLLFLCSFRFLCERVKAWPLSSRPTSENTIPKICSSVDRACVLYPKKSLCLQRSAVTACLLKLHGVAAQMTVGIRSMPFLAHAWVEADGAVVNDWPGVRRFYNSVASY